MIARRQFLSGWSLAGLGLLASPLRARAAAPASSTRPETETKAGTPPEPDSETELDALRSELDRGLAKLRLPGAEAPYAARMRVVRAESLTLDGSYGGVVSDLLTRDAFATVAVFVGSRERDNSNFFAGNVEPSFRLPARPDPAAARKRLWLARDRGYGGASGAYHGKLSAIDRLADKQLPVERSPLAEPVTDLDWAPTLDASAPSLPDVVLPDGTGFDRAGLRRLATELSRRFAAHPSIDNGDVVIQQLHSRELDLHSEGTVVGRSSTRAVLGVLAQTQAPDGMELDHGLALHHRELVTAEQLQAAGEALVDQVLRELEELVAAPMLDEDYDGPVLLEPLAAAQLLASTVAVHLGGDPAPLSSYGRVLELEPYWQDRLGRAVMPEFIDLVDDPGGDGFGSYTRDAEGTSAARLELVRAGVLHSLLMTRRPNAHIADSNGRARVSPGGGLGPCISNLALTSRRPGASPQALERELLARAREDGYEFAFVIESLRDGGVLGIAPRDSASVYTSGRKVSLPLPSRVFRLERSGGKTRRTLVRGALLAPMSMRVLRRIRAVGRSSLRVPLRLAPGLSGGFAADLGIDGLLAQTVDTEVSSPALLVDGLELLVERGENERLPILTHPLRRDAAAPPASAPSRPSGSSES